MIDTIFLRCLAILFITNSHLDKLYPLPILGGGGALGNALFFMLSGLGLGLSGSTRRFKGFIGWFGHRAVRIYPPLWIVLLVGPLLLMGGWKTWGWQDYAFQFLYPTSFWFISALLPFYGLIYPLLRFEKSPWTPRIMLGLTLLYFSIYCTVIDLSRFSIEDAGLFKWIFYFQVMLFGFWLVPHYKRLKEAGFTPARIDLAWFLTLSIVYIGLKVLILKGQLLPMQFLAQAIIFPWIYSCLRLSQSPLLAHWMKIPVIGNIVTLLGTVTLEIYLLQHGIYTWPLISHLAFPVNVLFFWLVTVGLAVILFRVTVFLKMRMEQRA